MKLYSTIHKCEVDVVGVVSFHEIICITEDGRWIHGDPTNLLPIKNAKPDMSITVGHVIDNPTFDTEFAYKIGRWDDTESDWVPLYDSRTADEDVPAELLIEKVCYLTIDNGQLLIEVNM